MKKIMSSIVAALVAVAFAGVVFAADATPAAPLTLLLRLQLLQKLP